MRLHADQLPFVGTLEMSSHGFAARGERFHTRRQDGKVKLEPIEEVICEVADEFSGGVIEALTVRKGEVSPCSLVTVSHLTAPYMPPCRIILVAHLSLILSSEPRLLP